MTRMVELEEAGVGPLWINPDTVRSVSRTDDQRAVVEFTNGDQRIVMGLAPDIAALLQKNED